ncbi:SH3 domain-containing protein [Urbifossiella limnaea]|uniref:Uncharacterized protein n=1 Tax=Urbifossiella limnaea TaxID=2528023 RepID=A0A517XNA7_9BACT|nr:hypothetical protein [Urbifossiella limnaea]QDU18995.1 hypothetical protein ETAA1_08960 [Urbifossiella limnaea]
MPADRGKRHAAAHLAAILTVVAVLVAHAVPLAPRPGNVRHLVAAYLADEDAAREAYRDVRFTASGTVNWSHRTIDIMSRLFNDDEAERSPDLERAAREATVYTTLPGGHQVLADFDPDRQAEALAIRPGDRVTVTGRHTGSWFGGGGLPR